MSSNAFSCQACGTRFTLPAATLERYPGWTPKLCLSCRDKSGQAGVPRAPSPSDRPSARTARAKRSDAVSVGSPGELNLPVDEVLRRFSKGPLDGVFTDGACSGNPGPGGWGAVYVRGNEIIAQDHGRAAFTTNNQMELTALIAGYRMLEADAAATIYTDSQLCVRTINEWAAQWERRGWQRRTGPVKNLELVQEAYRLARAHPKVDLRWIKAHDGSRWNEYADALATAYLRERL